MGLSLNRQSLFSEEKMKHTAVIKTRPTRSGKHSTPDGALCGNGDIGVILGEHQNGMSCHISKADFWLANEKDSAYGGIKPVGTLDFDIPFELYKNYYVEQRMDDGEIFCRFSDGKRFFEILIFVSHNSRTAFFELVCSDESYILEPRFVPSDLEYGSLEEKEENGIKYYTRSFSGDELHFETRLTVAVKSVRNKNRVISSVSLNTNFDSGNDAEKLDRLSEELFEKEKRDNRNWWKAFYEKSCFKCSDSFLEMNWYASQYMLAVCSLNRDFPPGLYGNFITTDKVNWKGDYHLNYNYQGSFYGACSSNHVELTDCYAAPLLALRERGKEYSEKFLGQKGVFYPVAIGPKGMITEKSDKGWERLFLGQRSNAIHSADIMIMRWYATYDKDYARNIAYPFFLDIADFWEGYLVKRDGVYNVVHDSIHEIPYYRDDFDPEKYKKQINEENNLLTLGLLKMFFKCIIDMSAELEVDGDRREKWREIVENLHDYPTFRKKGKKVFRYTSKGTAWNNGNTLCIQHIYPCSQLGLSSNPKLLKIAKNTFFANNRWNDDNGGCSYFPCSARIGVKPEHIIKKLKQNFKKFQLPNMLLLHGGGCLENSSIACTTLNEMVLQSYDGTLRIFPVWDRRIDCSFENLRADGAFLVSASMKNGKTEKVKIISERGRRLKIKNPFSRSLVNCGTDKFFSENEDIEIETQVGMTVLIVEN